MPRRVVLAMSGGVDSSAAAVLLARQGYEVVGLFMRSGAAVEACGTGPALPVLGEVTAGKPNRQGCCSAADAADARRVADRLDVPFHALNFSEAFGRIKDYFADEYLAGRTPNPCVVCNTWLKFGKLWEFAESVGADAIASGHYARIEVDEHGMPTLLRGVDRGKDQSYVLFGLDPDLLDRVIFPLGGYQKPEIRALAAEAGLRVADKPDSQEICFVPDQDHAAFIRRYRDGVETAGEFVDAAGTVLGEHGGYERFTVGQRRGLGIALGTPRFVTKIDPATRRVTLGSHDDLAVDRLTADRTNWLCPPPAGRFDCTAKVRYRGEPVPAVAEVDGDELRVRFPSPQHGVSPGQACVLYDDDRVLGGGWIAGTGSTR